MRKTTSPTIPELAPGVRVEWQTRDGQLHTGTITDLCEVLLHVHEDGTHPENITPVSRRDGQINALPLRKDGQIESNRRTPTAERIRRSAKAHATVRAKIRTCLDCGQPFHPTGLRSKRCEPCSVVHIGRRVLAQNRRYSARRCSRTLTA